ncbi:MAG: 3-dehydroquinate synthase II [Aigarchaeota archaeon]|nr:3-dehydroquinate synthase II [Aigarchaeota archaeon]MDW8092264.1 3-dehydroquinate synthase II [Nitrososphaerota archaeon]
MRSSSREVVIEVNGPQEALEAYNNGATAILCDPSDVPSELKGKIKVYDRRELKFVNVKSQDDVLRLEQLVRGGSTSLIVEPEDLKVIPLENVVAVLQRTDARLFARASSVEEVETLLGILERGVDGVVYRPRDWHEVKVIDEVVRTPTSLELRPARVVEVVPTGMGDRACVDTSSMLRMGEGMLVGSMSRMLFLVHSEVIGSKFTPPRPFRVNAGAVHMYTLMPKGVTRYLSEITSGQRVLVVDWRGKSRVVSVGRVKIERRPMAMVVAEIDKVRGAAILQLAETIRLVDPKGSPIEVTSLKGGEEVMVHLSRPARHMGIDVEESIDEV